LTAATRRLHGGDSFTTVLPLEKPTIRAGLNLLGLELNTAANAANSTTTCFNPR
jgi:hypothetical protein